MMIIITIIIIIITRNIFTQGFHDFSIYMCTLGLALVAVYCHGCL